MCHSTFFQRLFHRLLVLLKVDGARAKSKAPFYVELSQHSHILRTIGLVYDNNNKINSNVVMLLQEYTPECNLYELLEDRKTMPNKNILIEIFL